MWFELGCSYSKMLKQNGNMYVGHKRGSMSNGLIIIISITYSLVGLYAT